MLLELAVMLRINIEFRPDRHHHPAVHVMNGIHHGLRIRETLRIKLMAAPFRLRPVAPVHHNVVYRYFPLAEPGESIYHFRGSLVSLAALPIAHCPFRHYRGLSRKSAVSAYDLVHVISGNEPPVHLR